MTTNNTFKKVKLITVILFFYAIPMFCFSQDADSLNTISLKEILEKMLPIEGREAADLEDCAELCENLKNAEILTSSNLQALIESHLDSVLQIEKEICEQMKENGDLSASVSTGTYSAEEDDMPQINKGIYFTVTGLVRTMMDIDRKPNQETEEENDEEYKTVPDEI